MPDSPTAKAADDFLIGFEREVGARAKYFIDFIEAALANAARSTRLATKEDCLALCQSKLRDLRNFVLKDDKVEFLPLPEILASLEELEYEVKALRAASAAQLVADEAFLCTPLSVQCAALGIPLEIIELEKTPQGWHVAGASYRKPEPATFAWFKAKGYSGVAVEGSGILTLMKCASLGYLTKHNTFKSSMDACLRYFEAQCQILSNQTDEVVDQIRTATDATVRANLDEFLKAVRGQNLYPVMDGEALMGIWTALGAEQLAALASIFVKDPYSFRAGWPDLTLSRDNAIRFVEVKTTDKLHASQRDTIRELLLPAGMDVSVVRLKAGLCHKVARVL